MIRTDLGIATAYAEAVSKGYTGTRDEFGQMFVDFGKTAEKVSEDKKAVEQMKLSVEETKNYVDTTASEFGQNVADKTEEAKAAITEHANTEKESATEAISEAKDAATGAITEAQTSATDAIAAVKDSAAAEITKKGTDTLATIPEDYAALTKDVSSLKEDLPNKITKFYASNQGEIHIADSDNGKIQDMMLYGKSSQFTTTGKNLANGQNINCFINSAADTCGISSNDNGMVIDASKLTNVSISTRSIQDRYRFACANTVPTRENPITCYNGTSKDGTKDSYTMDTTGYNYLFINATKLEDIQVEKGSESTSYEPYTGGIPSPSPDYPQEIKSVVNPTVKVCGKNLLQPNIKFQDRRKINIKKGTILTLICKNGVVSQGGNLKFGTADGGVEWFGFNAGAVKQQTVLRNNVVSFEYLLLYEPSESYALYIGDENTYEPYKEQSVQLPYTLNAIPVSSGGNVTINGQQYIADYVDVERGKIVKCVEKYRIPSSLNWIYEPSENDGFGAYKLNNNINLNFGRNTLFTHYRNNPNGVGGFITLETIRLHNFQGFTDVTNFKEWLDKNESYAYFVKNTFEETDLTTEEIIAFKALATYYPTTNISVNSEQLEGYTVFNYPISMANGWNYVKQQLNDNRDYIYDMDTKTQDIDTQAAEAYVNSEYAVALTELEV